MTIKQEICLKAIDVLETHGFCQGMYGNEELGYCAVGALCEASNAIEGFANTHYPTIREQVDVYAKAKGFHSGTSWNDSKDRTVEEVISMFKELSELFR